MRWRAPSFSSPARAGSAAQQDGIIDGVTLIKAWDNWDAARGAVDLTLTEDQKPVTMRM
jgi:hypothetical protein